MRLGGAAAAWPSCGESPYPAGGTAALAAPASPVGSSGGAARAGGADGASPAGAAAAAATAALAERVAKLEAGGLAGGGSAPPGAAGALPLPPRGADDYPVENVGPMCRVRLIVPTSVAGAQSADALVKRAYAAAGVGDEAPLAARFGPALVSGDKMLFFTAASDAQRGRLFADQRRGLQEH